MVIKSINFSKPVDLDQCVRKFPVSTRLFVAGPSGSGKSTFLFNILSDPGLYFEKCPSRILYYYKTRPHRDFEKMLLGGAVEFRDSHPEELVHEIENSSNDGHTLICIDDGLNYTEKSNKTPLTALFNRLSNHRSLSLIFCSQILFGGSTSVLRQIFLNCNAFALFPSMNDKSVASSLSSRLFSVSSFLPAALRALAAESPFTPLIVITRPTVLAEPLRVFSGLLKGEPVHLPLFALIIQKNPLQGKSWYSTFRNNKHGHAVRSSETRIL